MLKSLENELATCSANLQKQVSKRGVLKHAKLPLLVLDLHKLAASTIGAPALSELNMVLGAANV